jgi:hypothetical protein
MTSLKTTMRCLQKKGVNDKLVRVENPGITPIQLNKDAQSPSLKEIISEKVSDISCICGLQKRNKRNRS